MTPNIALVSKLSQQRQDELVSLYDVTLSSFNERRNALAKEGDTIDIVYGNVRPFELPALTQLKWIHATWAGIENLCYPELIERQLIVTNVRGASADAMSEHALLGLLYFLRDVPCHTASNAENTWSRSPNHQLLRGSTIMVLGTGGIGLRLIQMLNGLGVSVVGANSDGHPVDGCLEVCTLEVAAKRLADIDHLICTLPLTPFTDGIIDHTWFEHLKPHSVFVNLSRGNIVNEPDLIRTLNSGFIRGAYLDVVAEEPLPGDNPLWQTPHVFITGHRSYLPATPDASPAFEVFKKNLGHFIQGQPEKMINVIDFEKGY